MAKLDAQFFKPFVDGTKKVLKTSCNVEITPGKPFIKGTQPDLEFDIAGVIGLTSNSFTGAVTICLPETLFLTLMSNMLGEKFSEITPDLRDGAAELLNMIFGQAKITLNEQGHTIQKAIPSVIQGKQLQTSRLNGIVMVLPFESSAGKFQIEIAAENTPIQ